MATPLSLEALLHSRKASRALAAQYDRTIRRIVRELAAGVSAGGAARGQALIQRMRQLLKQVDPKADNEVRKWILRETKKTFVIADQEATRELQAALRGAGKVTTRKLRPVEVEFTAINGAALQGVVTAMESTLGAARDQMEAALGKVIRQTQTSIARAAQLREATVSGFLRGATSQQIADDIASVLLGKGIPADVRARLQATGFDAKMFSDFEAVARGKLITVGKRTFSVRSYADLVANTQLREVQAVATLTRLRQNRVMHVQISKHVQAVPDECTPFAGRVFYIGDGVDGNGFPPLRSIPNGGPPFHPYCRHVPRPFVIAVKGEREVDEARAAAREIGDFLGEDARSIRERIRGLPPAPFRRIASQGETQKEAS